MLPFHVAPGSQTHPDPSCQCEFGEQHCPFFAGDHPVLQSHVPALVPWVPQGHALGVTPAHVLPFQLVPALHAHPPPAW